MMRERSSDIRVSRGVTLVEMVLAISMMTIILGAVLPLFAGIRNNWSTKQATAEITQNARILSDHLHRRLSQAVRITDVSGPSVTNGHIEFTANDGESYRYAVDGDYAQFGPAGATADLAGPVSQFQITCYDGNDFSTPTTDPASVRLVTVEVSFPNAAALGEDKSHTTNVYLRSGATSEAESGQTGPGVAIDDAITWGGYGMNIDSYRSSQGAYNPANPGSEAVVSVNATGSQKIVLQSQAQIHGDAYIGPAGDPDLGIKTWGSSEITGTRGALTEAIDISVRSAPFKGGHEGNLALWGTQTMTISADRYFNKLQLSGSSQLIIDGNVTIVLNNRFEIDSSAQVKILPNSSLTLYVKHNCSVWGAARLNDSTKEPSRLRIYMTGNNRTMEMTTNAVVHAVLENPRGQVSIWSNAEFFGKLKAATLEGGGRIHVDLDCSFDGQGN